MDKGLIAFLRDQAHALVMLARRVPDVTVAGELEALAIEILERARELDKSDTL